MAAIEITPASTAETRRLLRASLIASGQSAAELESQVTLFLQYTRAMGLNGERGWWCRVDGREVCACTCLESPGRTAMLMLPAGTKSAADEATICQFLKHVVDEEGRREVRLLQCLLATEDAKNAAALAHTGFQTVADLAYLERDVAGVWDDHPMADSPAAISWGCYDSRTHAAFATLIEQTYRDSQDCPKLTGLRDIEDIIAGHKAAGVFSPHRWLMVLQHNQPVGCMLLAQNPLQPALEIVYMGVSPEYRGKGWGRELIAAGLKLAHREGFTRVTLAVDSRNAPAMNLYLGVGFRETTRRRAMIHAFAANSDASSR